LKLTKIAVLSSLFDQSIDRSIVFSVNNFGQPVDMSTKDGTRIGIVNQSSNTPKKGGNPKDDRDYSYNDDVENLINSPPIEAMPSLHPRRTRASGTEDEEWSGSGTDDDSDDEDFLLKGSAKTAAKKKPAAKKKTTTTKKSNATKSTAAKPATKHEVKRRGNINGATKGMKLNMSAAGSAKHSQTAKENNKNRRSYGEKTLPVLNDSSTPVPKSISDKFSRVVTFKDIMEWCRDKNGKLIGIKVWHHPALMMWFEQENLAYLHKTMMRLGFRHKSKYEGWYNRREKIYRKFEPIRDGSKSMVWTHPTFNPESSVTDLTASSY
jgi:hypothetical protein